MSVEREILDWLGLLPDSDALNTEPDYENRLRKLGANLHFKSVLPAECLLALALHYLSIDASKERHANVGRARQLFCAARVLTDSEELAEALGKQLEAAETKEHA